MEKRLGTWIGGYVSYGGKEILINSCLSSIPLYAMGFYKLPEGVHKKMDSVRGRFYWQGIQKKKKKYHMLSLGAMSRPKDYGGLGFLETRKMNLYTKRVVNNGRRTSFWDDVWLLQVPLRVYFEDLYKINEQQGGTKWSLLQNEEMKDVQKAWIEDMRGRMRSWKPDIQLPEDL
ncbi:hypothetical protein OsJ_20885 [Oryza sativa Japonica Group]|uniref:Uncharacterized protein n=1 Tax=Oryza sativa subsp. japonica TaxID=39947 RepID=B9FSM0_ORYSJ|nr:hypothetical protein OsJ_20885 [Oryza sativa Japonica Group]